MTTPSQSTPVPAQLLDSFGRRLHYLRLSITDLCNLRCRYCMPPEGIEKLPQDMVLTLEELARVSRIAVGLGVDKIRLTGGEPLLRKGLSRLLTELKSLTPRPDLRITTNGLLLAQKLPELVAGGVSTVNVSLDSLKPDLYGEITGLGAQAGGEALAKVRHGLQAALKEPNIQVKINVVLLGGVNEEEIVDFARLTLEHPLAVRFIEYMPVGRNTPFQPERFLAAEQVLQRIRALGEVEPLPQRPGDGPAQRLRLAGAPGELGVISALSSHFCATCNRIRLSSEGQVVPCLLSEVAVELKPLLRGGADDAAVAKALLEAARLKPQNHHQAVVSPHAAGCQMSRLGG
ncbi:MAG: GTP 3',8-cyclase MoaA [Desulfarculaceae bacterium]|nr:GTP 3',8-cyclase MoaA [Desulfarculaceae bacterium]MCF8048632.1 GTP 3',8-cyclase MoaA [Desulfarculaceae bacterium]MCF8063965.1 GTP 3',8-cyclase MoaA [Desulfarculaceae bacterium]MCF8096728.1 GTP 3',8-cyclase MoaA [Desulfarculaceae bacterium]MCF8123024.1 GTP 3',8-cyclase MoaA [Desulfarculaceae bacterium]